MNYNVENYPLSLKITLPPLYWTQPNWEGCLYVGLSGPAQHQRGVDVQCLAGTLWQPDNCSTHRNSLLMSAGLRSGLKKVRNGSVVRGMWLVSLTLAHFGGSSPIGCLSFTFPRPTFSHHAQQIGICKEVRSESGNSSCWMETSFWPYSGLCNLPMASWVLELALCLSSDTLISTS